MIDRCVCNDVTFERALEVAEGCGAASIEELQQEISICNNCRMCQPYIQEALETGRTEFELHPDD